MAARPPGRDLLTGDAFDVQQVKVKQARRMTQAEARSIQLPQGPKSSTVKAVKTLRWIEEWIELGGWNCEAADL